MPSRYNPDKHHRRSIRLKGYDYTAAGAYFITICTHQRECLFGIIEDSEMRLNQLGQIVQFHWLNLPRHHSHVQLDEFIVMPNHFHGIIWLGGMDCKGGFSKESSISPQELNAKPAPTRISTNAKRHGVPEIVRGFKTFSARRINQIRKRTGIPVWQRNYYEHIIRDDRALHNIRQYIQNNLLSWRQDQLHPDTPSKW
jgi:REP element-mobilizing transposase RayT